MVLLGAYRKFIPGIPFKFEPKLIDLFPDLYSVLILLQFNCVIRKFGFIITAVMRISPEYDASFFIEAVEIHVAFHVHIIPRLIAHDTQEVHSARIILDHHVVLYRPCSLDPLP